MTKKPWLFAFVVFMLGFWQPSSANEPHASSTARSIYVISDLHFGVGKKGDSHWDPHEDFRWPMALNAFLKEVSKRESGGADLVIAGDLLELWQPPAGIPCRHGGNRGCSIEEVIKLATYVADQHKEELASLGAFASNGANHVFIVPGNHDAAILIPRVWEIVSRMAKAVSGRLEFVPSGIWVSEDGLVVVEHGHQIGADVNRFPMWPEVTIADRGTTYLQSPWGERFVQRIFNDEEARYPIIDNLIPESAGARIRLADRGLWKSVQDVARFIEFNVLQTSFNQKIQALGNPNAAPNQPDCDAKALGYKLILYGLPADDDFRVTAEADSPDSLALRKAMDARVSKLSEDETSQLCAAARSNGNLGALLQAAVTSHEAVMRTHLLNRLGQFPRMQTFVYAHTHQIETPQAIKLSMTRSVSVANDGAFQRLVSESGFRKRAAALKIPASDGLAKIPLEILPACYGFVYVSATVVDRTPLSQFWSMDEKDASGRVLEVGDPACE
jgi:UDP-2,3-diacylglucosamine pyrophosphatase LpxH